MDAIAQAGSQPSEQHRTAATVSATVYCSMHMCGNFINCFRACVGGAIRFDGRLLCIATCYRFRTNAIDIEKHRQHSVNHENHSLHRQLIYHSPNAFNQRKRRAALIVVRRADEQCSMGWSVIDPRIPPPPEARIPFTSAADHILKTAKTLSTFNKCRHHHLQQPQRTKNKKCEKSVSHDKTIRFFQKHKTPTHTFNSIHFQVSYLEYSSR